MVRLSGVASDTKRTSTATAPSFGSEAMRLAVSFDAPWYTSGVQKWNGKTASL